MDKDTLYLIPDPLWNEKYERVKLSKKYINVIKTKFNKFFKDGEIYLFGSRVDEDKKGGDIDLYFVLKEHNNLFEKKIKFLSRVKRELGEQKIDIIFNQDKNRFIEKEAIKWGNKTLVYRQEWNYEMIIKTLHWIPNPYYHIVGARLKNLGKKWFAFSKMNMNSLEILRRLG